MVAEKLRQQPLTSNILCGLSPFTIQSTHTHILSHVTVVTVFLDKNYCAFHSPSFPSSVLALMAVEEARLNSQPQYSWL